MIYSTLLDWAKEHNVIEECQNRFWCCYDSYEKEDPEEFSQSFTSLKSDIELKLHRISHEFYSFDPENQKAAVIMDIFVKDSYVGYYKEVLLTRTQMRE